MMADHGGGSGSGRRCSGSTPPSDCDSGSLSDCGSGSRRRDHRFAASTFTADRAVAMWWLVVLLLATSFPVPATGLGITSVRPSLSSAARCRRRFLQMNDVRRTPNKRDKQVRDILESVDFSRTPATPAVPLMEDPLIPMIGAIVNAADGRKAQYMSAFRVSSVTEVTTFFVVLEGNSRPQNQAIALAVEDAVLVGFQQQPGKQGDAASGWILLDYGSVIVHVMTPQMRNFYKLEKRWKDAEVVDLDSMLTGPRAAGSGGVDDTLDDGYGEDSGDDGEGEDGKDEDDPFWK